MEWIKLHLLTSILGLIPVGMIASLLYQAVKVGVEGVTTIIDKMPAWAHRMAFAGLSAVVIWMGKLIGINVTCAPEMNCLTQIDQPFIAALLKIAIVFLTGLLTHKTVKAAGVAFSPMRHRSKR